MRERKIIILLFLLWFLSIGENCFASRSAPDLYREANLAYQEKDYLKAIDLYQDVIKQGHISPELYYNLGNAWYKSGDVPHSILNYERALKMNPGDEDAIFNLKIASLKVVDKIDPVPQIFYKRWIDSLTTLMSTDNWCKVLIAILWLSLIFALIFLFGGSVRVRKSGFILAGVCLFIFLIAFLITSRSHSQNVVQENAIVMSASVYVKSSPDSKGNDLFIIHEGTKVEVLDELNEWKKIKLLNGNVGWLLNSEIEKI